MYKNNSKAEHCCMTRTVGRRHSMDESDLLKYNDLESAGNAESSYKTPSDKHFARISWK